MSLRDLEASDKQYALLEKLGYEIPEEGMSSGEASAKIKQLLGNKNKPKDITHEYSPQSTNCNLIGVSRDALIVRQSCLKAAVEMVCNHETYKTINVLELAENFEKWVNR